MKTLADLINNKDYVDLRALPIGTKLLVQTRNNLYEIIIIDDSGIVSIKGGKYFSEPVETHFSGSTWGGYMLKIGCIGRDMHMEIFRENQTPITTSKVKKVTIIGPSWTYDLEWTSESNKSAEEQGI